MFRWLVPRHQAEVAATTWTKKTAVATARQKRRRNVSGRVNRSPRTTPKKNPSRCSEPVGGTDTGWLAEEVENLLHQYCRPGEPAIANHQTHHEVNNELSSRLVKECGIPSHSHRAGRSCECPSRSTSAMRKGRTRRSSNQYHAARGNTVDTPVLPCAPDLKTTKLRPRKHRSSCRARCC